MAPIAGAIFLMRFSYVSAADRAGAEVGCSPMARDEVKTETLEQEANHVLEEARMVLPGIQALFGFQLIAVFNERFATELAGYQQRLHLGAIVLVALAVALIMAPAAYHRQAERGQVSRHFIDVASNLLTWAMAPLLLGIVLDVFLVSHLVLGDESLSLAITVPMFAVFVGMWFVYPRFKARRKRGGNRSMP
jgi:hypothetical protein